MSGQNFKVATLTMDIEGTRENNFRIAGQLIDEAAQEWGVKMVCLPELFMARMPDRSTTKQDMLRVAEPIPGGPSVGMLADKAKQHGIYIVGGTIVELAKGEVLYETCPFIGPDGKLLGKVSYCYTKMNTAIKYKIGSGISMAPEEEYGPRVFETPLGRIGIVAGEDRSSLKAQEKIKSGKPDVVFNVANVRARTTQRVIRLLSELYAGGCLSYVVFSNVHGFRKNVKDFGDILYDGTSAILNSGGLIIAQTTVSTMRPYEWMAVAMIDLKLLDKIRENVANRDNAVAVPW